MFANFLIGLREALEASLVVSILVAYVVRTGRRHLLARIWGGVGLAAAISLGFGALLVFGPRGLDDEVEEAIAGVLSVLAVVFVTWMIFWMARAARGMGAELRRRVDSAADAGRWSLAIVALLAVGREGLETALFLWAATSAAVTDAGDAWRALLGAGLGIVTAVVLGWLIYRGALSLDLTASSPGQAASSSWWPAASWPTASTTSKRPVCCPARTPCSSTCPASSIPPAGTPSC
ncbi:MAG: FTR1 family protein [Nocardioides sp.]